MTWRVIHADVLDGLAQLPDASVQTVVTSPPYWGLRDYGTATWEGGDAACDHAARPSGGTSMLEGASQRGRSDVGNRTTCGKCHAVRIDAQLGLEPTPEAYVEKLVGVFREVRRVLRPDGTAWLNLGDSYAATHQTGNKANEGEREGWTAERPAAQNFRRDVGNLKPKDLVGIPWRVAFALQADGWYLRSDVIWAKPNPMPESVTDRPTKAHEYVFLLTRSARYFFDADAVREPHLPSTLNRIEYGLTHRHPVAQERHHGSGGLGASIPPVDTERMGERFANHAGRNMRSVWTIPTEPYPEAHFATFPKALVVPCVKAGSRIGDTVLDPFAGSGTVGLVALRYGRSFVGIELNPTYAEMARERIRNDAPLWNHAAEVV